MVLFFPRRLAAKIPEEMFLFAGHDLTVLPRADCPTALVPQSMDSGQ